MNNLTLNLDRRKRKITQDSLKEIEKIYKNVLKGISKELTKQALKDTYSSGVRITQLINLQRQINAALRRAQQDIENSIERSIYDMSIETIEYSKEFLKQLGLEDYMTDLSFSYVPEDIVRRLTTGQIYTQGWSLSKSIWKDANRTSQDLYRIVASGIAQNKDTYSIAKDLEQYVNPSKRKSWNLKDKDGRYIYPRKIDYNAQRLARTLIQHSYQQSFVETTRDNPLISYYRWIANGSRRCEICIARNGKTYKKNELPLDHPNGMCIMEPVISKNRNERLRKWVNGGTDKNLDNYARKLGYTGKNAVGANNPKPNMKTMLNNKKYISQYCTPDKMFDDISSLRKSDRAKLVDLLSDKNVSVKYRYAFKKAQDGISEWSSGRGSYFSPRDKSICISSDFKKQGDMNNIYRTVFHEMGHAIDHLLRVSYSSSDNYIKALKSDLSNFARNYRSSMDFIDGYLKDILDDNSVGVQDIISGMKSLNKYKDLNLYFNWSHSDEYWKKNGKKQSDIWDVIAAESFAHLSSAIVSQAEQKFIKKYLPKLWKEYQKIIDEIFET